MQKPNLPDPVTDMLLHKLNELVNHSLKKGDISEWAKIFKAESQVSMNGNDNYIFSGFISALMNFSTRHVVDILFGDHKLTIACLTFSEKYYSFLFSTHKT